jgi:hypothetical protein
MNYITQLEKERYNDFIVAMGMALMFGETNKAKDELRKVVHNLQVDNIINPIEADNYNKMINSEDDENFILAKELIQIKYPQIQLKKPTQNGINIYSRSS